MFYVVAGSRVLVCPQLVARDCQVGDGVSKHFTLTDLMVLTIGCTLMIIHYGLVQPFAQALWESEMGL